MYQFPFYLFQGLCFDPSALVRNLKKTLFKFLELLINLVYSCLFLCLFVIEIAQNDLIS